MTDPATELKALILKVNADLLAHDCFHKSDWPRLRSLVEKVMEELIFEKDAYKNLDEAHTVYVNATYEAHEQVRRLESELAAMREIVRTAPCEQVFEGVDISGGSVYSHYSECRRCKFLSQGKEGE